MLRLGFPKPIDIAKINKDAEVVVFKKDEPVKKPKVKSVKKVEPEPVVEEKPKRVVKKVEPVVEEKKLETFVEEKPKRVVKKVEPEPVKKAEPEPVAEEKPKRVKMEKGSDLAKQWGLMMKEKRDAKKAMKIKEMEEPLPEFM